MQMKEFYHIKPKDSECKILGFNNSKYIEINKADTNNEYYHSLLFDNIQEAQMYIDKYLNSEAYVPDWILINEDFICPECNGILKIYDTEQPTTTGYPPNSIIYLCTCEKCLSTFEIVKDKNYNLINKKRYFFG